MKKIVMLFMAFLLPFTGTAFKNPATVTNELSFRITYHDHHLGYVKAVKQSSDALHTYTVQGRAEANLLLKRVVSENSIHSVFEKDELIRSTTFIKRNGKTLNNTSTKLLQGKYIISATNTNNQLQRHDIHFTVALLYFQEPLGIDHVYSETWGKLLTLSNHQNKYSFTIPDGTTCTFRYKDGALVEVTSDTIIGEIKFTKE